MSGGMPHKFVYGTKALQIHQSTCYSTYAVLLAHTEDWKARVVLGIRKSEVTYMAIRVDSGDVEIRVNIEECANCTKYTKALKSWGGMPKPPPPPPKPALWLPQCTMGKEDLVAVGFVKTWLMLIVSLWLLVYLAPVVFLLTGLYYAVTCCSLWVFIINIWVVPITVGALYVARACAPMALYSIGKYCLSWIY